jgi:FkbM family methyltransferase
MTGREATGTDVAADIRLALEDGWVVLPASLRSPDGAPRFHLTFPRALATDAGARYLMTKELGHGYELPTRNLVERALRPGDLFVDVGAHWGFFALQAATHPAGDVTVVAFEPDPTNAAILSRNISRNALAGRISLIGAACGDAFDVAPLVSNSTMMHSIRGVGLKPPYARGPARWVPVVTLDGALARIPQAADARIIIKVDAEGFEPQVMAGAAEVLRSGRVAMVIWECGDAFADGPERAAMRHMAGTLSALGFRHLRPPSQDSDGPLTPFDPDGAYTGNVFSHRAELDLPDHAELQ